jgi:hypothetical protein
MGADPASSPPRGGAVNRPLARVEDLASDLVRSLPAELSARAVLLPKAPPDLVTANRTIAAEGDRAIPLTGLWRDERFPDDSEQDRLQALSDAIDAAAGFEEGDHRTVEYTTAPKGIPGSELDAEQRGLLRALLGEPPARRQPRPLGVARSVRRLRARRPRRPPQPSPLTGRLRHHRG